MTVIGWVTIVIGAWVLVSVPVSLLFGRLLCGRDPLAAIPVIADEERRPLPPALRATAQPTVSG